MKKAIFYSRANQARFFYYTLPNNNTSLERLLFIFCKQARL